MRCIFCLQERPATEEHIFSLAIGGCLTIDRVCVSCNSTLGSRVDVALSDNFVVRMRRASLGLAGNSGLPPAPHELLIGVHQLTDHPGRVQVTFNRATGKLDLKALHHASDLITPDGTNVRQIIVDAKDIGQLGKIIKRERKRHRLPPLSDEQLAAKVRDAAESVTTITNPRVHVAKSVSFAYLRHAMIKIAYELAFLWLGESYLEDPSAARLRAAICTADPASTDQYPAWVGDAEDCGAFEFWSADRRQHLAYAFADRNLGIAIAVRVFDIHAAIVWVTKNANTYLGGPAPNALRFLAIDPESRSLRNVPFMEEMGRMAVEKVANRSQTAPVSRA